jgi:YcaO-like protein with predicted kinase domain
LLPAFGITRIANVTGLDRLGIPVWLCIRPNGRCLSVSQGKGVTDELAQASAVMESIELYHAERVAKPEMVASYREACRHHRLIDPGELAPGVRSGAYKPTRKIAWIRGMNLGSGEPVFVPQVLVDVDWSRPHPDGGLFFVTTTGLASGNHRLEALCHGLFEVVERYCEWRWDQLPEHARQAREVNSDTIESPMLRRLLDQCARARIRARMWDITSDVGLPAYSCTLSDPLALGGLDPAYGAGCHLSKEIALARALSEAAQCRLTVIAGSRDDVFPSLYGRPEHAAAHDNVARGTLDFRKTEPLLPGLTFEDDLDEILRRLAAGGFRRAIAVEHTRPEFGIPVVTVVVPGMREVR